MELHRNNFKAISSSYIGGSPVPVPIIKLVPSEMQEIQHAFCYFFVYVCAVGVRREREGGGCWCCGRKFNVLEPE